MKIKKVEKSIISFNIIYSNSRRGMKAPITRSISMHSTIPGLGDIMKAEIYMTRAGCPEDTILQLKDLIFSS